MGAMHWTNARIARSWCLRNGGFWANPKKWLNNHNIDWKFISLKFFVFIYTHFDHFRIDFVCFPTHQQYNSSRVKILLKIEIATLSEGKSLRIYIMGFCCMNESQRVWMNIILATQCSKYTSFNDMKNECKKDWVT